MDEFRKLTTQEKALRINLSKAIYGRLQKLVQVRKSLQIFLKSAEPQER